MKPYYLSDFYYQKRVCEFCVAIKRKAPLMAIIDSKNLPVYTFRVNTIDPVGLASQALPNNMENIILGLKSVEIIIPYWPHPLKYGDVFTLYGTNAIRCYETYIGKEPKVLELIEPNS